MLAIVDGVRGDWNYGHETNGANSIIAKESSRKANQNSQLDVIQRSWFDDDFLKQLEIIWLVKYIFCRYFEPFIVEKLWGKFT